MHRKPGAPHALRKSVSAAMAFIWLHPLIAFTILYATVSIDKFFVALQLGEDQVDHLVRMQLCASCFCISGTLTVMRMLHKGIRYHLSKLSRLVHTVFRITMASFHLVAYLSTEASISETLLQHAGIAFTLNILDVFVNIYSTKRKIAAASASIDGIERSSTVQALRKSFGLEDPRLEDALTTILEDEDESFYVDFNDRRSFVKRSSNLSPKDLEDFMDSTGNDANCTASPFRSGAAPSQSFRGSEQTGGVGAVSKRGVGSVLEKKLLESVTEADHEV